METPSAPQRQQSQPIAACFTVYENYFPVAAALAIDLVRDDPDIEAHIFLERGEAPAWAADLPERVIVHQHALLSRLPKELPPIGAWPMIVYARLYLADALPQHERILYLDADIARIGSLKPLATLDFGGHSLAAVQDGGLIVERAPGFKISNDEWLQNIGLKRRRYFNTGMMLMNAPHWRGRDLMKHLHVFFDRYGAHTRMQDQDFLNYFFQDEWAELSPSWNFQLSLCGHGLERTFPPAIVHFTEFAKPWDWRSFSWDAAPQDYYRRLMVRAGLSADQLPQRAFKTRPLDKLKHDLWRVAYDAGVRGGKISRRKRQWDDAHARLTAYYQQCLADGAFVDRPSASMPAAPPDPAFNGKVFRCPVEIAYP